MLGILHAKNSDFKDITHNLKDLGVTGEGEGAMKSLTCHSTYHLISS
jgi:hypothetical protein